MKKIILTLLLSLTFSGTVFADQTYDFVLELAKKNVDRSGIVKGTTEKCFTSYQDIEGQVIHGWFSTSASLGGGTYRSNPLLFQGEELYQDSVLNLDLSTFSYSNSDGYRTLVHFDGETQKIKTYDWFYKESLALTCELAE